MTGVRLPAVPVALAGPAARRRPTLLRELRDSALPAPRPPLPCSSLEMECKFGFRLSEPDALVRRGLGGLAGGMRRSPFPGDGCSGALQEPQSLLFPPSCRVTGLPSCHPALTHRFGMANAESECDTGDWIGNSRLESSLNARCVCAPVRSCRGKGIAQKDRGACRRDPAGAMIGGVTSPRLKRFGRQRSLRAPTLGLTG